MFKLVPLRVLVLPDEGSDKSGVVVEDTFRGYSGLTDNFLPSDPDDPPIPPVHHTHVFFIKEATVEVEIEGVTHRAMGINAIVGYEPAT